MPLLSLLSKPLLYLALAGIVISIVAMAFAGIKNQGKMEERARQLADAIDLQRRGRQLRNDPIDDTDAWLRPRTTGDHNQ